MSVGKSGLWPFDLNEPCSADSMFSVRVLSKYNKCLKVRAEAESDWTFQHCYFGC